jgi:hypothetical protein
MKKLSIALVAALSLVSVAGCKKKAADTAGSASMTGSAEPSMAGSGSAAAVTPPPTTPPPAAAGSGSDMAGSAAGSAMAGSGSAGSGSN